MRNHNAQSDTKTIRPHTCTENQETTKRATHEEVCLAEREREKRIQRQKKSAGHHSQSDRNRERVTNKSAHARFRKTSYRRRDKLAYLHAYVRVH